MASVEPQSPERRERRDRSARETARLVLSVVLLVVLVAFVLDNRDEVDVGYVFGDAEVRLIYVLVITALAGAVLDRLLRWRLRRRWSRDRDRD